MNITNSDLKSNPASEIDKNQKIIWDIRLLVVGRVNKNYKQIINHFFKLHSANLDKCLLPCLAISRVET